MKRLEIAASKDHFICEGKPFFFLADTVWSSFANTALDEWREYLDFRQVQGFTALQMNILPQWDASQREGAPEAFHRNSHGETDYGRFNAEYFDKACVMLSMAVDRGFVPALVLLWCTHVKGTWGQQLIPGSLMPLEAVKPYVEFAVKTFAGFNPVWLISGDTDIRDEEQDAYYLPALELAKRLAPDTLTTLHLNPNVDLPERYIQSPHIDFYMYQSGHDLVTQEYARTNAKLYHDKSVKRPVINGEPCYEGHGHLGRFGRFSAFDVRRASWQSLLSGAKAGIGYGAHGTWGWHSPGLIFPAAVFSGEPYDWRKALRFVGAWDMAFARWIFETYNLFSIEPARLPSSMSPELCMAISPSADRIVLYIPYPTDVVLPLDLYKYDCVLFSLSSRRVMRPGLASQKGNSVVRMHEANSDALFIGVKK